MQQPESDVVRATRAMTDRQPDWARHELNRRWSQQTDQAHVAESKRTWFLQQSSLAGPQKAPICTMVSRVHEMTALYSTHAHTAIAVVLRPLRKTSRVPDTTTP